MLRAARESLLCTCSDVDGQHLSCVSFMFCQVHVFINGGFYSPASYPAGSLCSIDPVLPLIRFLVLVLLKLRAAQVAVSWAATQCCYLVTGGG